MRRPLVAFTLVFCLGIVIERSFRLPFAALYSSALCFFVACALTRSRQKSTVLLGVMVCVLGMAAWRNNWSVASSHLIRLRGITSEKTYAVRGWVTSQPRVEENKTSFLLQVEEVASKHLKRQCCGKIHVIIRGEKQLAYGQELALEGRLHRPFGRYRLHEAFFVLRVLSPTKVLVLNDRKGSRVVKLALALRSKIEGMLGRRLSPISASVIGAMVLGQQNDVPAAIYRSMTRTGTVHILARLYTKMPSVAL